VWVVWAWFPAGSSVRFWCATSFSISVGNPFSCFCKPLWLRGSFSSFLTWEHLFHVGFFALVVCSQFYCSWFIAGHHMISASHRKIDIFFCANIFVTHRCFNSTFIPRTAMQVMKVDSCCFIHAVKGDWNGCAIVDHSFKQSMPFIDNEMIFSGVLSSLKLILVTRVFLILIFFLVCLSDLPCLHHYLNLIFKVS